MEKTMEGSGSELDLPGFRFHPTEEELLDFYLRRMVRGTKLNFDIIGTINLYRHDPWELPRLAKIGEREWYFFVPRDRRQSSGGRPNRTTERGFWKATGSDRPIRSASDPKRLIGLKKTLVFYMGRAPRGSKTDWVMNEYRLPDSSSSSSSVPPPQEDIVLCKIYRKATSLKELEQRAAMEEEARNSSLVASMPSSEKREREGTDHFFEKREREGTTDHFFSLTDGTTTDQLLHKEEMKKEVDDDALSSLLTAAAAAPAAEAQPALAVRSVNLPEIQVPKYGMEWMQDPFLTQLRSPWLDQWSPLANLLNF